MSAPSSSPGASSTTGELIPQAGAPIEELAAPGSGAPLEVLRLVLVDGVMELRFCGARVRLGRVEG